MVWAWLMRSMTDFRVGAVGEEPGGVCVAEVVARTSKLTSDASMAGSQTREKWPTPQRR
jgi:hypothetical protein